MAGRAVNHSTLSAPRPTSRYSTLARTLESEIASGRYRVGQRIPTEAELQERFDVSRHTVREALRDLKGRGLVSARAGIGTVVRAKPSGTRLMIGIGTIHELIQFVEATRTRLIRRREVIADEDLAQKLGARPGQQWIEASVLRFLPEERIPVSVMSLYVRPEHGSVLDMIDRAKQPVFSLLERHHGLRIAEVKQRIVAVVLGRAAARALEARAGAPALEITRHYLDAQDRPMLVSIGRFPSDRYTHDTKFRLQNE
jgi:DNA-binding GntR family transcriptional regulator